MKTFNTHKFKLCFNKLLIINSSYFRQLKNKRLYPIRKKDLDVESS